MKSRLAKERQKRNLSQADLAEAAEVEVSTVSRWERGLILPRKEHARRLCAFLGKTARELGIDGNISSVPLTQNHAFTQIAHNPITSLMALATTPVSSYDEASQIIKRASEEMSMQHPTRRDMLTGLLSGLITLPISGIQSDARWEDIINQCTIAIAACHELSSSGNGADLALAFHAVSAYIDVLKEIARDSPRLRGQALDLIARCSILKTMLGWHYVGDHETIPIAKSALFWSKEVYKISHDPSLFLSAYSKLASAYHYIGKDQEAFQVISEAEQLLLLQSHKKLPAIISGGTYSTLALIQAKIGQNADYALGKANEADPGEKVIAYMEFTRMDQICETGVIYYYGGDQINAMKTFDQVIDRQNLTLKISQSEAWRLGTIHTMAQSCLEAKDRDMEQIVSYWEEIIHGAHTLQSEHTLNNAHNLYKDMKIAFPGESRIKELRSHLVHW